MVIEGMLALTGQHFIIDYNERMGTLPAFVEGFTNVARDEHRHVAFGARFLRDMAAEDPRYGDAIQRTLAEVGPVADGVLRPKWIRDDRATTSELFGDERRRDARVRDQGARAPAEGHRPRGRGLSSTATSSSVDMRVDPVAAVDVLAGRRASSSSTPARAPPT